MEYFSIFFSMVLSLFLGVLVGAQREMRIQKRKIQDFAGFRTYSLICLLGFIVGFLSLNIFDSSFILVFSLFGMFLLCVVAYRTVSKIKYHGHIKVSIISEIAAILVFLTGVIISLDEYHFAISLAVIITLVLFLGEKLHNFAKVLTYEEIYASLKFGIISIVLLPFLPNKTYSISDLWFLRDIVFQSGSFWNLVLNLEVFNFFNIWLMVVFISGIAFVGYILMKSFGAQKGIVLTGFLGGLMSSTALTSSFAIESKRLNYLSIPLVVGTTIACSTMFFRILFEVLILNSTLFLPLFLPMFVMGVVGCFGAIYIFKTKKLDHVKEFNLKSPFTIKPAIEFTVFFVLILFLSGLAIEIFGPSGILVLAFFSGIADVDAITISLAALALNGQIEISTAVMGIVLASFSNTLVKGGISYFLGSKIFGKSIVSLFLIIISVGLLSIIIF